MAAFGAFFDAEVNKIRADLQQQLKTDLQQQLDAYTQQHLEAGRAAGDDRVASLSTKVDGLQDTLAKMEYKMDNVQNELNAEQKTSRDLAAALTAAQTASNDLAATVGGSLATMSASVTNVTDKLRSLQERFDDKSHPENQEDLHELKNAMGTLTRQYRDLQQANESNQEFIDAMAQVGATQYHKSMGRGQDPLGAPSSFTFGNSGLASDGAGEELPQPDPEPSNTMTGAKRTAHERHSSSSSEGTAKKVQRRRAISDLKKTNDRIASRAGIDKTKDSFAAVERNGLWQPQSHAHPSRQARALQAMPTTGPLAQFLQKTSGEAQADETSSSPSGEEDNTARLEVSGALRRSNRASKPISMDNTVDISKLKPSQLGKKERMR